MAGTAPETVKVTDCRPRPKLPGDSLELEAQNGAPSGSGSGRPGVNLTGTG